MAVHFVPVRDPLGAALGRANGPWEGVIRGWGCIGVELGLFFFFFQGLRAPVTDGWLPRWVAGATGSVARLICGVDSVAEIKRHCGR